MEITRIGLDIAKRVFQVHGVDERGRAGVTKRLSRAEVLGFFAQLRPCLIGIEACGGAHYWGRELTRLGHTVKLMAAQFISPYRKSGKNDVNDAEAICEALSRPNMRFVGIKSEEQQAVLMMHRVRTLMVANRTAGVNQVRGLLGEFGVVVPIGSHYANPLSAEEFTAEIRFLSPGTKSLFFNYISLALEKARVTCYPMYDPAAAPATENNVNGLKLF
jgi:transposase